MAGSNWVNASKLCWARRAKLLLAFTENAYALRVFDTPEENSSNLMELNGPEVEMNFSKRVDKYKTYSA
jgi:hypothetical protein